MTHLLSLFLLTCLCGNALKNVSDKRDFDQMTQIVLKLQKLSVVMYFDWMVQTSKMRTKVPHQPTNPAELKFAGQLRWSLKGYNLCIYSFNNYLVPHQKLTLGSTFSTKLCYYIWFRYTSIRTTEPYLKLVDLMKYVLFTVLKLRKDIAPTP